MYCTSQLLLVIVLASLLPWLASTDSYVLHSSAIVLVANGTVSQSYGNVVVTISGTQIGAICDANWSVADATVVCRELGFK